MSAYVVDREHIVYLVEAARSVMGETARRVMRPSLRWRWKDASAELRVDASPKDCARVAQMLWDANIHGVACRYPDSEQGLPGPADDDYTLTEDDVGSRHWEGPFDPVQVIKACDCYAYQTCEDPEWKESEAYAFIQALRERAIYSLVGYDRAEWGAPAPVWPLKVSA